MLQRPGAAVLDRYLSSRSPPDHLLNQMLKMVPVCGGGSCFRDAESTCGRAGRLFFRIIFFVFFCSGSGVSEAEAKSVVLFVVVISVVVRPEEGAGWGSEDRESESMVISGGVLVYITV